VNLYNNNLALKSTSKKRVSSILTFPKTSSPNHTFLMRETNKSAQYAPQDPTSKKIALHNNTNLDAAALDPLVLLPLGLLVLHLLLRLPVLLLLLLSTTILHLRLLLLARIPAGPGHRVRSRMMRLPILRVLRLMLLAVIEVRHLRRRTTSMLSALPQININPPLVLLGVILQSQFPADFLDFGFNLLHVPDAVVSLAHNHMQVPLPRLLRVSDALLQNLLCFFDELPVQVDGVGVDAADGVVFAENVLGCLLVQFVGFGGVGFALDGEVVGGAAVAALVGLLGARGEGLVLRLFVAGGVAKAVVFAL
jgi:hypothetical protein